MNNTPQPDLQTLLTTSSQQVGIGDLKRGGDGVGWGFVPLQISMVIQVMEVYDYALKIS